MFTCKRFTCKSINKILLEDEARATSSPDRTGDLSHATSPMHLQVSIFHAHDAHLHTKAILTAQIAARRQSLIVSASAVAEVQQPLDVSQDTIR